MLLRYGLSALLMSTLATLPALAFEDFDKESSRISRTFDCVRESVVPASTTSQGELFSCIGGRSETVKVFINAAPHSSDVVNMKVMWNEWTKDIGDGIGTDRLLAKAWVSEFADMYFPAQKDDILPAFFSKDPVKLLSDDYEITYEYQKGPAIDQHLIVVTPHAVVKQKSEHVASYVSDFQRCKDLVANTVSYGSDALSGDGDPAKESGYDSFMIKGQGKDIFFCEIHRDGAYKIKAALGGNFPFRYIDEGRISQ